MKFSDRRNLIPPSMVGTTPPASRHFVVAQRRNNNNNNALATNTATAAAMPSSSSMVVNLPSPPASAAPRRHHRHHHHHHHRHHHHAHEHDEDDADDNDHQQQSAAPTPSNAANTNQMLMPSTTATQSTKAADSAASSSIPLPPIFPPPPPPPPLPARPMPPIPCAPPPSMAAASPPFQFVPLFVPKTATPQIAPPSFSSINLEEPDGNAEKAEELSLDDDVDAMMELDLCPDFEVEFRRQNDGTATVERWNRNKHNNATTVANTTSIAADDSNGNGGQHEMAAQHKNKTVPATLPSVLAQLPPPIPPPKLPHPNETPANIIPPEMERDTQNWRQYAVAALLQRQNRGARNAGGLRSTTTTNTGTDSNQQQMKSEMMMDEREWPPDEEEEDEEGDDHHHADYAAAAFRDRRSTVTYRFPTDEQYQQKRDNNHRGAVARKLSMGQQRYSMGDRSHGGKVAFATEDRENEQMRRLSLTERNSSLFDANYAILRKSVDRFEVVGSFHRCNSEAYRHFLQSLTCYDLATQHGLIAMLDEELPIQKAVQIACAHPAPRVAIISNCRDAQRSMFTVTDCLLALHQAHTGNDAELGSHTLRYFVEKVQSRRKLIFVDEQTSVWDLMRVFTLNRVHRVPVFSIETSELTAILCPRVICMELLKLLDSKCALQPNLHIIPLKDKLFGTWGGPNVIASLKKGQNCAHAVDVFLKKQVSTLPVLSAKTGNLLGVLDKNDLLDHLYERLGSSPTPEHCFRLMEETPVEDLLPSTLARRRTVRADISVAEAMRTLTEDGLTESLFVVEPTTTNNAFTDGGDSGERLCGVISNTDILVFILTCEQTSAYGMGTSPLGFDAGEPGAQPATAPTCRHHSTMS